MMGCGEDSGGGDSDIFGRFSRKNSLHGPRFGEADWRRSEGDVGSGVSCLRFNAEGEEFDVARKVMASRQVANRAADVASGSVGLGTSESEVLTDGSMERTTRAGTEGREKGSGKQRVEGDVCALARAWRASQREGSRESSESPWLASSSSSLWTESAPSCVGHLNMVTSSSGQEDAFRGLPSLSDLTERHGMGKRSFCSLDSEVVNDASHMAAGGSRRSEKRQRMSSMAAKLERDGLVPSSPFQMTPMTRPRGRGRSGGEKQQSSRHGETSAVSTISSARREPQLRVEQFEPFNVQKRTHTAVASGTVEGGQEHVRRKRQLKRAVDVCAEHGEGQIKAFVFGSTVTGSSRRSVGKAMRSEAEESGKEGGWQGEEHAKLGMLRGGGRSGTGQLGASREVRLEESRDGRAQLMGTEGEGKRCLQAGRQSDELRDSLESEFGKCSKANDALVSDQKRGVENEMGVIERGQEGEKKKLRKRNGKAELSLHAAASVAATVATAGSGNSLLAASDSFGPRLNSQMDDEEEEDDEVTAELDGNLSENEKSDSDRQNSPKFVLSSGRISKAADLRSQRKPSTISDEFEQYFSQLLL